MTKILPTTNWYKNSTIMKTMLKEKGIITNDKQRFLDAERHYFTSMTTKEYREIMYQDADSCEQCGVWSWNGCAKRCDCK